MPTRVVENWDQFVVFLASQPLCRWAAEKEQQIAAGLPIDSGHASIHPPPKKNDNADLAAALASMA